MSTVRLKLAKIIRVATIPPIAAAWLVSLLYFTADGLIENTPHYITALFFLSVLPVLAYPISALVPAWRERDFQRKLAIVFSVLGYIGGTVFAFASGAPEGEIVLYLTYLISGVLTAVCSFVFKFKASGHACGIAGPIAMLVYRLGAIYLIAAVVLFAVYKTSLTLKRHTLSQLISGSAVPVAAMFISIVIYNLKF